MNDPAATIPRNLARIRARITEACRRAGRPVEGVRPIVVTKNQDPSVLPILRRHGVRDFGENRLEHLATMLADRQSGDRFHAIGRVQGRQLAGYAPDVASLHSLCDPGHIERLDRAAAAAGRRLPVFIQVNASGETAKSGLAPDSLGGFLARARSAPHLEVVGLMTMAPELGTVADEAAVRRCFRLVRELAVQHCLPRISMGMSLDYPIAIEEGATDVRIGTAIFADDTASPEVAGIES